MPDGRRKYDELIRRNSYLIPEKLPREIRNLAEEEWNKNSAFSDLLKNEEEVRKLVYELEVHQIELEMQNSEIRRIRDEMESYYEKYAELYHYAPSGYFTINSLGVVLEANLSIILTLGVNKSFFIGQNIQNFVVPTCLSDFNRFLNDVLDKKTKVPCEILMNGKDGKTIHVYLEGVSILGNAENQIRVAAMDVSPLREAEKALRESEDHYRTLVESIPSGIVLLDRKGRIISANQVTSVILGFNATTGPVTDADDVFQFIRETDRPKAEGIMSRALSMGITQSGQCQLIKKDGSKLDAEVSFSPVRDADRNIKAVMAVINDITELKKTEAANRIIEERMLQVQKLQSLGVMAGGIAHDFNNLLTVILGCADLSLSNLNDTSLIRENMEDIRKASGVAAKLCRQMLAFAGKGTFEFKPFDLSILVGEMEPVLTASVLHGTEIEYTLGRNPLFISADESQIMQMMLNLVINSTEAMAEKRGTIKIVTGKADYSDRQGPADFTGKRPGRNVYVSLEVKDNGTGMEQSVLSRIFDPFFSTKFAGRGLGLAAVYGIVSAHGGFIYIKSSIKNGTAFKILFPMIKQPQNVPHRTEKTPDSERTGAVLIVDDEMDLLKTVKKIIEKNGFTIYCAADGLEAVSKFREHEDKIDCILLDYTMPRMNGYETLKELRKIRDDIPVVITSGYSENQVMAEFSHESRVSFLQKPYPVTALIRILSDFMEGN
ncbi:MAG: PAS domain S-box protein [Spirochaetales bacterium]|nr:PAS domain S-box protein [Spirochaetales bacterium]